MSIPSVAPLRAYVYDNIVLRLCREPYQQDLSNAVSGTCVWEGSLGLFSAAGWVQAPMLLPSSAWTAESATLQKSFAVLALPCFWHAPEPNGSCGALKDAAAFYLLTDIMPCFPVLPCACILAAPAAAPPLLLCCSATSVHPLQSLDSYVIAANYQPPWETVELHPYIAQTPNTLLMLKTYLDEQGATCGAASDLPLSACTPCLSRLPHTWPLLRVQLEMGSSCTGLAGSAKYSCCSA